MRKHYSIQRNVLVTEIWSGFVRTDEDGTELQQALDMANEIDKWERVTEEVTKVVIEIAL